MQCMLQKAHLIILKRGVNVVSRDSDLHQLISTLTQQLSLEASSIQESIDISMKRVTIDVGKQLLEGNALLLPSNRIEMGAT